MVLTIMMHSLSYSLMVILLVISTVFFIGDYILYMSGGIMGSTVIGTLSDLIIGAME